MAKIQDILEKRDELRRDVEDLDGGYTTVSKHLKKSRVHIFKALKPTNTPRLSTLEEIRTAVTKAQKHQDYRVADL